MLDRPTLSHLLSCSLLSLAAVATSACVDTAARTEVGGGSTSRGGVAVWAGGNGSTSTNTAGGTTGNTTSSTGGKATTTGSGGATGSANCGVKNVNPFNCEFAWGGPNTATNASSLDFVY